MSPLRPATRTWVRSLIATAINGFASGVILIVAAPETFNLGTGLEKLLGTSTVFAIVGLANFLKQHPLPDDENTVVLTDRITNTTKE